MVETHCRASLRSNFAIASIFISILSIDDNMKNTYNNLNYVYHIAGTSKAEGPQKV